MIQFKDYPQYKPEAWKPKKYAVYEPSQFVINIPDMKWNTIDKDTSLTNLSMACIGGGGCGKTTTLIDLVRKNL